jgi:hypothetical protein
MPGPAAATIRGSDRNTTDEATITAPPMPEWYTTWVEHQRRPWKQCSRSL